MPGRWRAREAMPGKQGVPKKGVPEKKGKMLGLYFAASRLRSVLDFESFAGRGQMLDGRVLGASQVEYNPFGKPPLKCSSWTRPASLI